MVTFRSGEPWRLHEEPGKAANGPDKGVKSLCGVRAKVVSGDQCHASSAGYTHICIRH